jgi:hypothetical protein
MVGISSFFARVKRIPGGFKRLFYDCVEAYKLNKKSKNGPLTRREKELMRTSVGAAKKVGIFFILQLPPIIGLLPVTVSLSSAAVN